MRNVRGDVSVYAPERGGPQNRYTIDAYDSRPGQHPYISRVGDRIVVCPARCSQRVDPGSMRFLIRAPQGVAVDASTGTGNINVADVTGVVHAATQKGDVKMLVPGYADADVGSGDLTVYFGATSWPGTLHFRVHDGNAEIWVNATARAHVHLHTDNGSIFTDFPLKGFSKGTSETIDAAINGGGPHAIDVEIHNGIVRLLQLKPQI